MEWSWEGKRFSGRGILRACLLWFRGWELSLYPYAPSHAKHRLRPFQSIEALVVARTEERSMNRRTFDGQSRPAFIGIFLESWSVRRSHLLIPISGSEKLDIRLSWLQCCCNNITPIKVDLHSIIFINRSGPTSPKHIPFKYNKIKKRSCCEQ